MLQRVKIRLKGIQDTDLFLLKANNNFNFEKAIKKALIAYVRGEETNISIPSNPPKRQVDFSPRQIYIPLDTEDEADVISWLNRLKKGYRNVAVKTVFRNIIAEPNLYGMYEDDHVSAVKREVMHKPLSQPSVKHDSVKIEPAAPPKTQERDLPAQKPITATHYELSEEDGAISLFSEEDSFVDIY